jgi:hypothetical protein
MKFFSIILILFPFQLLGQSSGLGANPGVDSSTTGTAVHGPGHIGSDVQEYPRSGQTRNRSDVQGKDMSATTFDSGQADPNVRKGAVNVPPGPLPGDEGARELSYEESLIFDPPGVQAEEADREVPDDRESGGFPQGN